MRIQTEEWKSGKNSSKVDLPDGQKKVTGTISCIKPVQVSVVCGDTRIPIDTVQGTQKVNYELDELVDYLELQGEKSVEYGYNIKVMTHKGADNHETIPVPEKPPARSLLKRMREMRIDHFGDKREVWSGLPGELSEDDEGLFEEEIVERVRQEAKEAEEEAKKKQAEKDKPAETTEQEEVQTTEEATE
jgi:hypothetical protein